MDNFELGTAFPADGHHAKELQMNGIGYGQVRTENVKQRQKNVSIEVAVLFYDVNI